MDEHKDGCKKVKTILFSSLGFYPPVINWSLVCLCKEQWRPLASFPEAGQPYLKIIKVSQCLRTSPDLSGALLAQASWLLL